MKKPEHSISPFYDRDFARNIIRSNGSIKTAKPPPPPPELSTVISCRLCGAPARIQHHPTKSVYKCSACATLLATITPNAEIHEP